MKNLKNLGKTLDRNQQKAINGGVISNCPAEGSPCLPGQENEAVSCITASPVCEAGRWSYGGNGGGFLLLW